MFLVEDVELRQHFSDAFLSVFDHISGRLGLFRSPGAVAKPCFLTMPRALDPGYSMYSEMR